jgi:hypothetical protein
LVQKSSIGRARKLLAQSEPDLVAVGRLVRTARDNGNFKTFCDAVSLHPRKAYDLIAIADAVGTGRLHAADVQAIGWSKARLIAAHATTKGKAWRAVAFARENTLPALVGYFQGNGAGVKLIAKSFQLTVQQAQQLESALDQAGAQRHHGRLDNRAEALMTVVRGYRLRMKPYQRG